MIAARAFLRLSRPMFLLGGVAAVGLGSALAAYVSGGAFDWRGWMMAQLAVSSFHLMTHYSNDYFDREADVHTLRTAFSGGSGALLDGALQPRVALFAALAMLVSGLAWSALLFFAGHALAGEIAILIGVLCWFYSSPPARLLARGLGEFDTALIIGTLMPLCGYFAQNAAFMPLAIAATLPGAAATFALMLAVEVPDIEADGLGLKRNLLVRAGRSAIVPLGQAALIAVYAGTAIAFWAGAPLSVAVLETITLPAAFGLASSFGRAAAGAPIEAVVAGRGVAFFFLVNVAGLLGYAVPLHWRI